MTQKKAEGPSTKVVGGPARISYAHVFTPTSMDPDDPKKKYSVSLLVPKSNTKLVTEIRQAIKVAQEAGKPKWGGKIPPNLRMPLRDGDVEKPDDETYAGMWFIGASSVAKPGVVSLEKDEMGKYVVLTSDDEFYSGCWARFSINFFPYNTAGNKGVGCGLNHLQKVRDGERLGGRSSVSEDFDDNWEGEGEGDDDASSLVD